MEKEKYADPKICPNCNQYYEGYNGNYLVNDKIMCDNCITDFTKTTNKPFFVTNIPAYFDGATCKMFTFEDENDLYNKIRYRIRENEILVKSDNYLMVQNISKEYWWVLGGINKFNINDLNIPKINYYIYNDDGSINEEKLQMWLKDKKIITK